MKQSVAQREAEILDLIRKGVSQNAIRNILKVSGDTIQKVVKKHGMSSRPLSRPWTEEELAVIERLHMVEGKSPGEIFKSGLIPDRTKASIATRCYNSARPRLQMGKIAPSISKEEEARLRATIPDDTRNKTARIMGDPLPGRSALDMRMAA